ncbi:ScbR family autoregulator-binding transcription factor [Streptomyces sp. NPDC005408]|uniref:ScbR family autoregulator-binding transcription factor n=1 Tax=Streptomyces sp. NPDC005408 TaxID=3155341 RepID=UPI0033A62ED7
MAGSKPKQLRAVRTRAAIMRAGAEVFSEYGFAGASVAKIAQRAGLTLGAVYFHFESKQALAREIVGAQPRRVTVPESPSGLQGAVDITMAWARQLLQDPLLLAGARLVMDQEYFVSPEQENSYQQWVGVLAPHLYAASEEGELTSEIDVGRLARLVVNAATGAQMNAQLDTGRQDLPKRIEEIWRFLLPLIAAPGCADGIEFTAQRAKTA